MSRDSKLYFDDILQAIKKIEIFISGVSLADFRKNIDVVWETAKDDLPKFKTQIIAIKEFL